MWRVVFIGLVLVAALWLAQPGGAADGAPPALAPAEARADLVVVEKAARRMTLYRRGEELRSYAIGLGFAPSGDKRREGDGKTPEGAYRIDRRNAASAYHLSLGLDYPTPKQREAAAREGRDPGGDIFIHGQPNRLPGGLTLAGDWTAGCIAVSNEEIREIWSLVGIGAAVEVRP